MGIPRIMTRFLNICTEMVCFIEPHLFKIQARKESFGHVTTEQVIFRRKNTLQRFERQSAFLIALDITFHESKREE